MTFEQRMAVSEAHERAIIDRLIAKGWRAHLFGQSQLPNAMRDLLRTYHDDGLNPTLLRWLPDILAGYVTHRTYACLIDGKVCSSAHANYAVETSALDAVRLLSDAVGLPCFFVFDDFGVLTPRDVTLRGLPGRNSSHGSGTPYLLVERRFARPFDCVFPGIEPP